MIDTSFLAYVLVLLVTGIAVGFACGLLGIGGGFLMVPVQIWALAQQGIDPTLAARIAFGTSLAVVLPTALSGCRGHSCRGVVLWRPGIIMGLSGLAGAFLGGSIASHAPGELLKMLFGSVVLLGALRMLFASDLLPRQSPKSPASEPIRQYVLWGFAVGIVSGLTGIGGGVILVPAMVVAMGFGMFQAIGTSSLAIAFNALGGVFAYAYNGWGVPGLPPYSVGYIDLLQFALLAAASIFSARWGVRAAHRLPAERLKQIFVLLMIYIGLNMIGVLGWVGLITKSVSI
ncbi:MAG TPA: sulfite exporter TauE/SafE family protein [Methanothrix sp.]|nr:sulfite exporter TauE/SafE family protein [Methanothrix sp.]